MKVCHLVLILQTATDVEQISKLIQIFKKFSGHTLNMMTENEKIEGRVDTKTMHFQKMVWD